MGLMKELNDLNRIYQQMHKQEVSEDENKGYVVTRADKKGNTPAWQGYKSGKKNVKTGKPLYKAADHVTKEEKDQAFANVVAKLRAQHGKDAVITKDNPIKPPTPEQKAKIAADRAV